MMSGGVGDERLLDVPPPVGLEVEVEAEMLIPENNEENAVILPYRPHLPTLPMKLAPFRNARDFGIWLFTVMDQVGFSDACALFGRYAAITHSMQMRKLATFGKRTFRGFHRLYFFEGLLIIAASLKHKRMIGRTYRKLLRRML